MSNNVLILCIVLIIAVVLISYFYLNSKKNSKNELVLKDEKNQLSEEDEKVVNEILSSMEYQPYVIKDTDVLVPLDETEEMQKNMALLDAAIPNGAMVVNNAKAINAAKDIAANAFKSDINPALLDKSKEVANALRGSAHNGRDFVKNANWTSLSPNVNKLKGVMAMNAAFSVANVVVGQYNMTIITKEIKGIKKELQSINDILDSNEQGEFKSLMEDLNKKFKYIDEILSNDELRYQCINDWTGYNKTCKELFNSSESFIEKLLQRKVEKYEDYIDICQKISEKKERMEFALKLLKRLSDLYYTLNLNAVSKDFCYDEFNTCKIMYEHIMDTIEKWNNKYKDEFKVNTKEGKRERKKFDICRLAFWDENKNYNMLSKSEIKLIEEQNSKNRIIDNTLLYDSKIEVIYQNGKHYLLAKE